MMEFKRGEVYYINFPYTFDVNYPKGKNKFVVILQEGAIFKAYDAVTVLLITSDEDSKDFETNVTIEPGTTKLNKESYIVCAQPYTILKSLFEQSGAWCAGCLPGHKLDEVDECLYIGLCMGMQNEGKEAEGTECGGENPCPKREDETAAPAAAPRAFRVVIRPAEDIGGYWATCDMPNGGCTAQGATLRETQKNMVEAVDFYLEDYPEISDFYLDFEVREAEDADSQGQ